LPRKSLTLEPPEIFDDFARHYIRGYFDGDGCVGFDMYFKLTFVGGSIKTLEWIKKNIEKKC
jgi:intein-encoded DNA endonuclease-like protein